MAKCKLLEEEIQYWGRLDMSSKNKKSLHIRNSTAEFLIFTSQAGESTIEVRVEDETVWLTQKMIGELFGKGRSTIYMLQLWITIQMPR